LLIAHARAAVLTRIGADRDRAGDDGEPAAPALAVPGAAFVTLHVGGALRGCIGTLERRRPSRRPRAIRAFPRSTSPTSAS
jgi:AMMECR1 domain-containing protein